MECVKDKINLSLKQPRTNLVEGENVDLLADSHSV